MDIKFFNASIMKMYLYADLFKAIHYSTEKHWGHELCDDSQDNIRKYIDELAEQVYGYYGKPKFSDFTLSHDIYYDDSLSKIYNHIIDILTSIKKDIKDIDKLSGSISLIDDFIGYLNQANYLASFDKFSSYKSLSEL